MPLFMVLWYELCYEKLEIALESKSNMNQKICEDARHAFLELKRLIVKNFEDIKSINYHKVCKESITDILKKLPYASVVLPINIRHIHFSIFYILKTFIHVISCGHLWFCWSPDAIGRAVWVQQILSTKFVCLSVPYIIGMSKLTRSWEMIFW